MQPKDFWESFEVEIEDFTALVVAINQVMEKSVRKKLSSLGEDR